MTLKDLIQKTKKKRREKERNHALGNRIREIRIFFLRLVRNISVR